VGRVSGHGSGTARHVCNGLTGTRYAHKLRAFVELLADKEWQARAGAVRAIAAEGSDAASLLVRLKILTGDREPEVMADCFNAILLLDGGDAMPIVTSFAESREPEIREAALLALGTSRRPMPSAICGTALPWWPTGRQRVVSCWRFLLRGRTPRSNSSLA